MTPVSYGRTGLKVSPMCLGTMMFGVHSDVQTSRLIADMAFDHGIFYWDTADMYGKGASETVVGTLMEGRREQIVLATKAWAKMAEHPNGQGLSARHLISACEASLKRLKTDWIDLYYLHLPDPHTPIDETLQAIEDLRRSGKIRYAACSNYRAWETLRLIHCAEKKGWPSIVGVQPLYNVCNRDIEVELLPMCHEMGLGVSTYSPLARGVLTGKYAGGVIPPESRLARRDKRFLEAEWRPESVAVAESLRPVANRLGCDLASFSTAWAMKNPLVDSVIIGPKNVSQLQSALKAYDVDIDENAESVVNQLVPPGSHSGRGFFDTNYSPVLGRPI